MGSFYLNMVCIAVTNVIEFFPILRLRSMEKLMMMVKPTRYNQSVSDEFRKLAVLLLLISILSRCFITVHVELSTVFQKGELSSCIFHPIKSLLMKLVGNFLQYISKMQYSF